MCEEQVYAGVFFRLIMFSQRALFVLLASGISVATDVPSGIYCAKKSVLTHTAYVKMEVSETDLYFRIDGDMHWASCFQPYELDGEKITVPVLSDCGKRLVEQKTGGDTFPAMVFDAAADKITLTVENFIPIVGTDITVEFSKDCAEVNRMGREL